MATDSNLQKLHELVQKCASISSTKERCATFQEYGMDIKPLLCIIYDEYRKFHVTSSSILKHEKKYVATGEHDSLFELLTDLTENKLTGHDALNACLTFIKRNESYRETILKAINKDLKIRVGVSLVNQAFPMLVPTFSCALAHPLEKHQAFFDKNRAQFSISRKLDGCRCMFICEDGKVTAYSRSGHVYPNHIEGLQYFLGQFKPITGVLDGEMGVVDESGKEYFNIANALMNPNAKMPDGKEKASKNLKLAPNQYLCYFAFDLIPLSTFKSGQGPPVFVQRQEMLQEALKGLVNDRIRILPQESHKKMDEMWNEAETKEWEGLMLRMNTEYDGKKTRSMLKRKRQDDDEYKIEAANASMQMGPSSTEPELALENVQIKHKGNLVSVGSGFTWELRKQYSENPNQLVGMYITVCHNGESKNSKTKEYSLRHPRVKALYDASGRQN